MGAISSATRTTAVTGGEAANRVIGLYKLYAGDMQPSATFHRESPGRQIVTGSPRTGRFGSKPGAPQDFMFAEIDEENFQDHALP
ncbi:hypothetical protein [Nonomuraea sp. NPDC050643]|uniref:hypothetical protein n=1 Tax=Nonomuraea sp. NPDC050643 TaxID=3155660 RepID=UPI0033F50B3E